ncbi:MAG: DUF554 family protein, partial [Verrucomicrobia bacterium]
MTGTLINVAAILLGGTLSLVLRRSPGPELEHRLRPWLALFALYAGGKAMFLGLTAEAGLWTALLRLVLLLGGLSVGRVLGAQLGIQRAWNRAGQAARQLYELAEQHPAQRRFHPAFLAATTFFCLSPLAVAGPVAEGLAGDVKPLLLKSLLDGLAMLSFARVLGPGALAAAIPVLSLQGTLTLLARLGGPWLEVWQARHT